MKKLNIDELKVQSFITELKAEHAKTAKGGNETTTTNTITTTFSPVCPEEPTAPHENSGCCESGEVIGEASEIVTEYGCMLPEIIICG